MNLFWLTDIHLNFIDVEERAEFYHAIVKTCCDAVLISGDIAEAPSIEEALKEMVNHIKKPIYFVLGNHDYYRGQIDEVRRIMCSLTKSEKLLYWLPVAGTQVLTDDTVLIGQDGWADGRYGDYANSRVALNDSRLIADLFQTRSLGRGQLLEKMQQLADAEAKNLRDDLIDSINHYHPKKIIVLTHVPPFKEACWYHGEVNDSDYLPFFSSKATGDVLAEIAKANPKIELLVLCGHTHNEACYKPLDNLIIQVGKADYCSLEIQKIINV